MTKKEILDKLYKRKEELTKLPIYQYRSENSEFEKWLRFTAVTIVKKD